MTRAKEEEPRLGLLGVLGMLTIMASGVGGLIALLVVFSMGSRRGTSRTGVWMCRAVGWVDLVLVASAAIGLLIASIANG